MNDDEKYYDSDADESKTTPPQPDQTLQFEEKSEPEREEKACGISSIWLRCAYQQLYSVLIHSWNTAFKEHAISIVATDNKNKKYKYLKRQLQCLNTSIQSEFGTTTGNSHSFFTQLFNNPNYREINLANTETYQIAAWQVVLMCLHYARKGGSDKYKEKLGYLNTLITYFANTKKIANNLVAQHYSNYDDPWFELAKTFSPELLSPQDLREQVTQSIFDWLETEPVPLLTYCQWLQHNSNAKSNCFLPKEKLNELVTTVQEQLETVHQFELQPSDVQAMVEKILQTKTLPATDNKQYKQYQHLYTLFISHPDQSMESKQYRALLLSKDTKYKKAQIAVLKSNSVLWDYITVAQARYYSSKLGAEAKASHEELIDIINQSFSKSPPAAQKKQWRTTLVELSKKFIKTYQKKHKDLNWTLLLKQKLLADDHDLYPIIEWRKTLLDSFYAYSNNFYACVANNKLTELVHANDPNEKISVELGQEPQLTKSQIAHIILYPLVMHPQHWHNDFRRAHQRVIELIETDAELKKALNISKLLWKHSQSLDSLEQNPWANDFLGVQWDNLSENEIATHANKIFNYLEQLGPTIGIELFRNKISMLPAKVGAYVLLLCFNKALNNQKIIKPLRAIATVNKTDYEPTLISVTKALAGDVRPDSYLWFLKQAVQHPNSHNLDSLVLLHKTNLDNFFSKKQLTASALTVLWQQTDTQALLNLALLCQNVGNKHPKTYQSIQAVAKSAKHQKASADIKLFYKLMTLCFIPENDSNKLKLQEEVCQALLTYLGSSSTITSLTKQKLLRLLPLFTPKQVTDLLPHLASEIDITLQVDLTNHLCQEFLIYYLNAENELASFIENCFGCRNKLWRKINTEHQVDFLTINSTTLKNPGRYNDVLKFIAQNRSSVTPETQAKNKSTSNLARLFNNPKAVSAINAVTPEDWYQAQVRQFSLTLLQSVGLNNQWSACDETIYNFLCNAENQITRTFWSWLFKQPQKLSLFSDCYQARKLNNKGLVNIWQRYYLKDAELTIDNLKDLLFSAKEYSINVVLDYLEDNLNLKNLLLNKLKVKEAKTRQVFFKSSLRSVNAHRWYAFIATDQDLKRVYDDWLLTKVFIDNSQVRLDTLSKLAKQLNDYPSDIKQTLINACATLDCKHLTQNQTLWQFFIIAAFNGSEIMNQLFHEKLKSADVDLYQFLSLSVRHLPALITTLFVHTPELLLAESIVYKWLTTVKPELLNGWLSKWQTKGPCLARLENLISCGKLDNHKSMAIFAKVMRCYLQQHSAANLKIIMQLLKINQDLLLNAWRKLYLAETQRKIRVSNNINLQYLFVILTHVFFSEVELSAKHYQVAPLLDNCNLNDIPADKQQPETFYPHIKDWMCSSLSTCYSWLSIILETNPKLFFNSILIQRLNNSVKNKRHILVTNLFYQLGAHSRYSFFINTLLNYAQRVDTQEAWQQIIDVAPVFGDNYQQILLDLSLQNPSGILSALLRYPALNLRYAVKLQQHRNFHIEQALSTCEIEARTPPAILPVPLGPNDMVLVIPNSPAINNLLAKLFIEDRHNIIYDRNFNTPLHLVFNRPHNIAFVITALEKKEYQEITIHQFSSMLLSPNRSGVTPLTLLDKLKISPVMSYRLCEKLLENTITHQKRNLTQQNNLLSNTLFMFYTLRMLFDKCIVSADMANGFLQLLADDNQKNIQTSFNDMSCSELISLISYHYTEHSIAQAYHCLLVLLLQQYLEQPLAKIFEHTGKVIKNAKFLLSPAKKAGEEKTSSLALTLLSQSQHTLLSKPAFDKLLETNSSESVGSLKRIQHALNIWHTARTDEEEIYNAAFEPEEKKFIS